MIRHFLRNVFQLIDFYFFQVALTKSFALMRLLRDGIWFIRLL